MIEEKPFVHDVHGDRKGHHKVCMATARVDYLSPGQGPTILGLRNAIASVEEWREQELL